MNRIRSLTPRTALLLALSMSLMLNLLFMITFLFWRDTVPPPNPNRPHWEFTVGSTLIHLGENFLLAFVLYLLCFRLLKSKWKLNKKITIITFAALIVALMMSYGLSLLELHYMGFEDNYSHFIKGGMVRDVFICVMIILSSRLIYGDIEREKVTLENKSLMVENIRTRYEVLKNQVNPHFLFNSLNTLNAIIKTDADKAQEYVQQLAFVFRYTLQHREMITLEEELKCVDAYSHLMQIRYGNCLEIVQHIDAHVLNLSIIPLSLQILLENAIKHNVISSKQPLRVTIRTVGDGICISNPIQEKREPEHGEGIGLSTLVERYKLRWQREVLIQQMNGRFEVTLPLIKTEV